MRGPYPGESTDSAETTEVLDSWIGNRAGVGRGDQCAHRRVQQEERHEHQAGAHRTAVPQEAVDGLGRLGNLPEVG